MTETTTRSSSSVPPPPAASQLDAIIYGLEVNKNEMNPGKRNSPSTLRFANRPPKCASDLHLTDLPNGLLLQICGDFLDVSSLRSVLQVNKKMRALITPSYGSSGNAVWKPACQRQWPWLHLDGQTQLKDALDSSTTSTATCRSPSSSVNVPLVLGLAAEKSHKIDETLFGLSQRSRSAARSSRRRGTSSSLELKVVEESVVQFTGRVGHGDRCIRADEPLPRPTKLPKDKKLWKRLVQKLSSKKSTKDLQKATIWKPFVAPYKTLMDNSVYLSPRIVSYYEVSLLGDQPTDAECVAVGLADSAFMLRDVLPGWNKHSYGFHGDDGGLYHGSGEMVASYGDGQGFGAGDCIGCGVDYQKQCIFYTCNGKFLGYAFQLDETTLQRDLYPVVGMDTNCPVLTNFGTNRPFQFDLNHLVKSHRNVVLRAIEKKRQQP